MGKPAYRRCRPRKSHRRHLRRQILPVPRSGSSRARRLTVNQHLRREDRVRPCRLARDLDAVVQRRKGAERPASTAVPKGGPCLCLTITHVRWEGGILRNMLVSRLGDEAGAVDVSPAAGMSAGHEEPPSTGNTRARVGGREERAYSKPSGKLVTSMISCARCARKTTSRLNRGDELRAATVQRTPND